MTDSEVIEGDSDFYATTKAFHNALQGKEQVLTEAMLEHYLEVNRVNAERLRRPTPISRSTHSSAPRPS